MILGNVSSREELTDFLSNFLFSKTGTAYILLDKFNFFTFTVDGGKVLGFSSRFYERFLEEGSNLENLVLFLFAELIRNPSFSFKFEDKVFNIKHYLKEPLSGDNILLNASLVSRELEEIYSEIISPFALVKLQDGQGVEVFLSLILKERGKLVKFLRDFKKRKKEVVGFLLEDQKLSEVYIKGAPSERINIFRLMESLRKVKFNGIVKFFGEVELTLVFKGGEIYTISRVWNEFFNFLAFQTKNTKLSVMSLKEEEIDIFSSLFCNEPAFEEVPSLISDYRHVLISLLSKEETGVVKVRSKEKNLYFFLKEGEMLRIISERDGSLEEGNIEELESYTTTFYPLREGGNFKDAINVLFINVILEVFKKNEIDISCELLKELGNERGLKYTGDGVVFEGLPNEKIFRILDELVQVGIRKLGRFKFPQEVERSLQPYGDFVKFLNISLRS